MFNPAVLRCAQRMHPPAFLIAFNQSGIRSIHKKDFKYKAVLPHPVQYFHGVPKGLIRPHIQPQRRFGYFISRHHEQLHEFFNQRHRKIIHTEKSHILQHPHGRALPAAAHPGYNNESHCSSSPVPCPAKRKQKPRRRLSFLFPHKCMYTFKNLPVKLLPAPA